MAGQYKSAFRGSGIEFEEVREYTPGDEVKSIDWKVSARLGRPFIKRYREERELVIMLLVDMSASGSFGTTESLKKETAAELASILAFNAIRNNDKVGAMLFTDHVEKYIPPLKGSSHVWRLIKEIFAFEPQQRGTDIKEALRHLARVCRKRTVTFLISDFLAPGYDRQVRLAANKHEIIGVLLSDPGEFTLPESGIVTLEDFETGQHLVCDAGDKSTRAAYTKLRQAEYKERLENIAALEVDCIEVSTTGSAVEALLKYFRYREKRKR